MNLTIGRLSLAFLALLLCTSCVTPPPKIAPPPGIYGCPQEVTVTDAKADAAIYFTTDGSAPSTSSAKYSTPFPVNSSAKVQAIAQAPGGKASRVAASEYGCAMTRAQFAVLLQQSFSLPPVAGKYQYADLPDSGAVLTAIQAAAPYMDGQVLCPGCSLSRNFYPDQPVTLATTTIAFVRVLITSGRAQLATPQQTAALLAKTPDAASLPSTSRPYFATAISQNILTLSPAGEIRPTMLLTQPDIVRIVQRMQTDLRVQPKSPG